MKEFTLRAVLIGLVMTAILGSANAYLGLKAGMTIAATYPAAVIGMALLRLMKGSLLEENIARTVGSIGEAVAAGAVFTIPAFVMAGLWPGLTHDKYWTTVALMVIGGTLGILFVTLLRRVMVEDPELPFPESVAASEIHKAGQQGSRAAKILFANMGFGGFMYLLGAINFFSANNAFAVNISALGQKTSAANQHEPERRHRRNGRGNRLHRARRQPRVPRSRVHYRPAARVSELCRRGAGLGTARSAADFPSWTHHSSFAGGRPASLLDAAGASDLLLHCASHCGWGNVGGRLLHLVQDAQATRHRHAACRL